MPALIFWRQRTEQLSLKCLGSRKFAIYFRNLVKTILLFGPSAHYFKTTERHRTTVSVLNGRRRRAFPWQVVVSMT
jgi:hypothetical protein